MPLTFNDEIDSVQNVGGTALSVTSTQATPVWITGTLAGLSGVVTVTSALANPLWITSSAATIVTVSQSNTPAGTQVVTASTTNPVFVSFTGSLPIDLISTAATGGNTPVQTMYVGGNNAGVFRGISLDANGNVVVSQTNTPAGTQAVALTGALPGTSAVSLTGVTVNGAVIVSGNITAGDNLANPTNTSPSLNYLHGWNSAAAWDRVKAGGNSADNLPTYTSGILLATSYLVALDDTGGGGTTWQRLRAGPTADGQPNLAGGALSVRAIAYGWNGASFDKIRGNATTGLQVSQSNTPAGTQIVSSTIANPVWVTSTVPITAVFTASIPVTVTGVTVNYTSSVPVSVTGVTVNQTGTWTVSQSNTPAGTQAVALTGAIPGTSAVSLTGVSVNGLVGVTGVHATGAVVTANPVMIGGVDASGFAQTLGITTPGSTSPNRGVIVGGNDGGGGFRILPTIANNAAYGGQIFVGVGGLDNATTGKIIQVIATGNTAGDRTLIVGGVDGGSVARTFYVSTIGATVVTSTVASPVWTNLSASVTGNVTTVPVSMTGVALLAANANREGATIYNQSNNVLYLSLRPTASINSWTIIMDVSGYYETPFKYAGDIWGVCGVSGTTGQWYVTEIT
jgi:hypothetical protein